MAYTKKNYKKSSYKSKNVSTASLAMKVNKLVKAYKPEHKVHDAGIDSQSITFSGVCQNLSAIPAGDGQTMRDGHQVCVKSLSLKGSIIWNSGAANQSYISLYLIQDLQQQPDSSPLYNDIFKSSSGPLALLNRENFGRFKILAKKIIVQDDLRQNFIDLYVKCNIPVRFNNTGFFDFQKNGLYLCAASDRLLQTPLMTWQSRITYTDN